MSALAVAPRQEALASHVLDPHRCLIEFSVRRLGIGQVVGRAPAIDGDLELGDAPWVRVDVDAARCQTGHRLLDEAIARDFLAAEEHPIIRFESVAVTPLGPERADVDGDLHLGGRCLPLVLRARLVRTEPGTVLVSATGIIGRRAAGMTWHSLVERAGLVSDGVQLTIAAEFVR